MTRIYFVINPIYPSMYIDDDPRPPRELVKLINTAQIQIGADEVVLEGTHQWAMAHAPKNFITVIIGVPPVRLSPRQYDVLYGIADGKRAAQIASDLGIGRRTVYEYTALIKERFGVRSKEEVIYKAIDSGIL